MNKPISSAVIKLGGSIITFKNSSKQAVRKKLVARLGREILESGIKKVIIIHGAGSFGHIVVRKTGLDRGIKGEESLRNWSLAQLTQNFLNFLVVSILLKEGIPAFPLQPTGSVRLHSGGLETFEMPALKGLVSMGIVPVLFGVPALDKTRGCSILSGDQLAPAIAHKLRFDLVVHTTDVDGVYTEDPHLNIHASKIDVINRSNYEKIKRLLGSSRSIDVTGGMKGKVTEMMKWAKKGIKARIINGTIPGNLLRALKGENVGTFVIW